MKKQLLFTFFFVMAIFEMNAQMAITTNGSAPHNSAILDIQASPTSNAKGVLMPRIPDHNVITNPAKGLMIFNTTTNSMWLHNGTAWSNMDSGNNGWNLRNDTLSANVKAVGVNTTNPRTTMEVHGNGFVISQKLTPTTVDPNLSQNNMTTNNAFYSAPAGFLYDPSGPSANYPTGVINTIIYLGHGSSPTIPEGYKLSFEDFDTEANGDSLIIYNFYGQPIAKYSGNMLPPDLYISGVEYGFGIRFKTNGNNIVGRGFKMKWQQLFKNTTAPPVGSMIGNNLFYETSSGALRVGSAGYYPTATLGIRSVAMGVSNKATGDNSFALGNNNDAKGSNAFAMGLGNIAEGEASFAFGYATKAMGNYSTSLGNFSTASSTASFASGYGARALGES